MEVLYLLISFSLYAVETNELRDISRYLVQTCGETLIEIISFKYHTNRPFQERHAITRVHAHTHAKALEVL